MKWSNVAGKCLLIDMSKEKEKIILCTDPILQRYLKEQGVEAIVFDSTFSKEERVKILEDLDQFACNWFFDSKGHDYTRYSQVSIGAGIHDEIMNFFQLIVRFIHLLDDRIKPDVELEFYQSDSCQMPEFIHRLVEICGGRVINCDYKYPYLSYKKLFTEQLCGGNCLNLTLSFHDLKDDKRWFLGRQIKTIAKQFFSHLVNKLFVNKKSHYIYLLSMGNLVYSCQNYIEKKGLDWGLIISHNSHDKALSNITGKGLWDQVKGIYKLAKKDIFFDSLKPHLLFRRKQDCKKLIDDFNKLFPDNFYRHFKFKNKKLLKYLENVFREFYLGNLAEFARLIEFFYKKFSNPAISLAFQEYVHPLQAQVMANLRKPCILSQRNIVLHNQYGTPELYRQTRSYFKTVAISEFDRKRYKKLGFDTKDILLVETEQYRRLRSQIKPYYAPKSIRSTKILILPPAAIHLCTFRSQIQNNYLIKYLDDVLSVLKDLGIAKVKIRNHPGCGAYNQFGYTETELSKLSLNLYNNWPMKIEFADSDQESLSDNVQESDLVIGTLTGAILEVLVWGRDYVFFNDTYGPFEGVKDDSVFHEKNSMVKKLRSQQELREHLLNYQPIDRELFFKKYFDNFEHKEKIEDYLNSLM